MSDIQNPFFSIGYPERERLEIELLSLPSDKETEGYDWIEARAIIHTGGFSGDFNLMITKEDMVNFKTELEPLYKDLRGVAEFKTIEDQLSIRIEVNKLGHVTASGYLKDDASFGNRLKFKIEYDQTLLFHTICEINEALFQFERKDG
jgi:hypothetical protein